MNYLESLPIDIHSTIIGYVNTGNALSLHSYRQTSHKHKNLTEERWCKTKLYEMIQKTKEAYKEYKACEEDIKSKISELQIMKITYDNLNAKMTESTEKCLKISQKLLLRQKTFKGFLARLLLLENHKYYVLLNKNCYLYSKPNRKFNGFLMQILNVFLILLPCIKKEHEMQKNIAKELIKEEELNNQYRSLLLDINFKDKNKRNQIHNLDKQRIELFDKYNNIHITAIQYGYGLNAG